MSVTVEKVKLVRAFVRARACVRACVCVCVCVCVPRRLSRRRVSCLYAPKAPPDESELYSNIIYIILYYII